MALGNKGGFDNKTMYILKLKSKDADLKNVDPFFQVLERDGENGWVPRDKTENSVSGRLVKIEPKKGMFNGQPILSTVVYLTDGDELYLLDLKYTMLARSILNSLLSLEDFSSEVEIGLYKNKKGYPAASVRANGELLGWKFALNQLPPPTKVQFKGQEMTDFTDVDNFFQKEVEGFADKVRSESKADAKAPAKAFSKDVPSNEKVDELDQDADMDSFKGAGIGADEDEDENDIPF